MGTTNLDTIAVSSAQVATSLTLTPTVVTPAGSNSQANSTLLSTPLNIIAAISATTRGVRLPTAAAGLIYMVINAATTGMNVYPHTNGKIHTGSTNAAYDLLKAKAVLFAARDTNTWQVLIGA